MTTDANEPQPAETPAASSDHPAGRRSRNIAARAIRGLLGFHVGRVPVGGLVAVAAVVALVVGANYVGTPSGSAADGTHSLRTSIEGGAPAASAAPAEPVPAGVGDVKGTLQQSNGSLAFDGAGTTTTAVDPVTAALAEPQIVKTGSMALEVTDLNKAVSQAQAAIVGMGGRVSQSSSSGEKDNAVATVTYRLPAARWDDALAAIRGLGNRVISEQTDSTDVTAQVIDVEARLANLQATEAALQSIMARASAIPDVLAVEQQLSQTEGQIEQLKAQRDHLKDQAAMSTLTVSFSTPNATVTTQATKEWDLGAQIDEAAATLVHIGQGLATIVVWAVVVGVPVLIGLALLALIWWIVRRIARRRRGAPAAA